MRTDVTASPHSSLPFVPARLDAIQLAPQSPRPLRARDCFAVLQCNNPKNSCPVIAWVSDSAPVPNAPVSLAFPALRDIRGGSRIITRARRMAALALSDSVMASGKQHAKLREGSDLGRGRSKGSLAACYPNIKGRKSAETFALSSQPNLQPVEFPSDLSTVVLSARWVNLDPKNITWITLCSLICDGIIPPWVTRMRVLARSIKDPHCPPDFGDPQPTRDRDQPAARPGDPYGMHLAWRAYP